MKKRAALLITLAILALPASALLSGFAATQKRMRTLQFPPGTSVTEVVRVAGEPTKIVRNGETLKAARRSYRVPPIAEGTALYFYPRDGLPYFNAYVFVDEQRGVVIRSDLENLWW